MAATLPFLLLAEGCASGGTGALTRDAGTVEVVTGEGCAHEVRRRNTAEARRTNS